MQDTVFKFKKFEIMHNKCAMKVGTDGVLLGAWCQINKPNAFVLDIGCGSGLISIMLAQRYANLKILGIDNHLESIQQAEINFNNCIWRNRLNSKYEDFNTFWKTTTQKFDVIISNPPFFFHSYQSNNKFKQQAKHADTLTIGKILQGCKSLLNNTGYIYLILPYTMLAEVIKTTNFFNLYIVNQAIVYPKPNKNPNRILLKISNKKPDVLIKNKIILRNLDNLSTDEYINLTKEFYL